MLQNLLNQSIFNVGLWNLIFEKHNIVMEEIKKTDKGEIREVQVVPVKQDDTLLVESQPITTDERIVRVEQMLESLLGAPSEDGTKSKNQRTDAIYAEIERIRQSMSARREQGKANSQRIINNLARFDVVTGGRF